MKNLIVIIVLFSALAGCTKFTTSPPTPNPNPTQTKDLVVPASFNFQTTSEISVGIVVKNSSSTLSGVPVSIYLDYPGSSQYPNANAQKIGTYFSLSDGRIDVKVKVPAYQDSLYLQTNYNGIESEAGFKITGSTATYTYGEGNTVKSAPLNPKTKAAFTYTFMGTFDANGVPKYLETVPDKVSQGLLDSLNTSLPEGTQLAVTHPEYLATGNESDYVITQLADVWITFISEGSTNANALGYYTYNVATPPQVLSDIKTFTIVYPNVSLKGSGGGEQSGDKVKLGRFPAGTAIGWFLVANGWNGTTVSSAPTYFSDDKLNPETDPTKKKHSVLLYDNIKGVLVLGFEDLIRNTASSANGDFNDALFYISSNPVKTADVTAVPPVDAPKDTDKDGVTDVFDQFPTDPLRAYTNFYPSATDYTSLLVEDLWPSLGDFDFNDLVIDGQYENVTNAQTNVVELYIKLKVRAIGAGYNNGFGIQLPVPSSAVSSVTLTDQSGVVKNIGVEAGQSLATVIAFNDSYTLLPSMGGGTGVNVIHGAGYRTPVDIILHILFNTPQTPSALGSAPYNPFIFINGDRTKEIHMANNAPTAKAKASFFGQSDDASNPSTSTYYKSKNNLVWMIEVPSTFSYDIETMDITKAYLHFGAWAQSGGTVYKDWYLNNTGYRNSALIY
ncbi:MAG: LruC domain-containing protein [Mariniphaga sp.]